MQQLHDVVLPAQTGMIPNGDLTGHYPLRAPRADGDDPEDGYTTETVVVVLPQTGGSEQMMQLAIDCALLPA